MKSYDHPVEGALHCAPVRTGSLNACRSLITHYSYDFGVAWIPSHWDAGRKTSLVWRNPCKTWVVSKQLNHLVVQRKLTALSRSARWGYKCTRKMKCCLLLRWLCIYLQRNVLSLWLYFITLSQNNICPDKCVSSLTAPPVSLLSSFSGCILRIETSVTVTRWNWFPHHWGE